MDTPGMPGAAGWPDWGPATGRGFPAADAESVLEQPVAPDPQLGLFIVVGAALLIVAAFLPWATATPHTPDIGLLPGGPDEALSSSRDYIGARGLPGMAVLIAALAAAL